MSHIQIPEDAIRSVVAQAIMESITPKVREKILTDAVAVILVEAKPGQGWTAGKSPLALAFENAVSAAVHTVAREMVAENPEAQAAIRRHVGEAIAALCSDNYDGLPELIGDAIGKWLRERR